MENSELLPIFAVPAVLSIHGESSGVNSIFGILEMSSQSVKRCNCIVLLLVAQVKVSLCMGYFANVFALEGVSQIQIECKRLTFKESDLELIAFYDKMFNR